MSIETRASWVVAAVAVVVLSISFGSVFIIVVGLKAVAADIGGGQRSVPAFAHSLAWFSAALGGLYMAPLAERIGLRTTAIFGACMVAIGLALSSQGAAWQLFLGHGLFIGLLGNAGINAPLYVYITRWFDVHRGAALALITSGQYLAGAFWPMVFERTIAIYGWRQTMLWYGLLVIAVVVPLAAIFFRKPPVPTMAQAKAAGPGPIVGDRVLGLRPNSVFVMMMAANFLCCVPMAMPSAHMVAFCGDLGMTATAGAAMLSMLLVIAMLSRQFWGWLSDRIGGLLTIVICSAAQAAAIAGFALTQDEAGLFFAAAAFGLGFSGLIPAYVLVVRELFPASQASWRVPALLLSGGTGMAFGGWFAGYIYDHAGHYAPAFSTGLGFNLVHLAVVSFLAWRWWRWRSQGAMPA